MQDLEFHLIMSQNKNSIYSDFFLTMCYTRMDDGQKGNKYYGDEGDFVKDYILETPEEVKKNKIGLCWDQVEYLRDYLEKKNVKVKTYFLIYYEGICPTHTFLIYEENYFPFQPFRLVGSRLRQPPVRARNA